MTSHRQHSICLAGLAGFSLVLALGGCSGDGTGSGSSGGAGGGATATGGGSTSTGGTGGRLVTATTGGTVAASGGIQSAGGATGGTGGTGGASGGTTATGGSKATGGVLASGGTAATGGVTVSGGSTATGGVTASGGRTGGAIATGGTAGTSAADAGMTGGAAGGGTGGANGGAAGGSGGATLAGGIKSSGGITGGSKPAGGTSAGGGSTGGSTGSGPAADTSDFHCVNWADTGDNFQNGVLQPSGLTAASDTYATVKAKADAVLSGFQTLLQANTVRIPINEPTVVTNTAWWTAYKGIIDSAISKNMKVIIGYWAIKGGTLSDPNAFYNMWQTVIDAYVANDLVYFEIMNEPYALQPPDFINFAVQWLARYPNVPKNRVIIAGDYTDTDVNKQGADPRLAGCLLSLHIYNFSTKATTVQDWKTYLTQHVGPYYKRTIATEYGVVMTTGIVYTSDGSTTHTPDPTPSVNILYMAGVTNQFRDWGMGSCLWVGLRNNDTTSITKLNGTGTDLSLTVTNTSALARIQWGWGL